MGVDIDFSTFSLDDLMAVARHVNVLKKEALDKDSERLGALAQPLADVILVEREVQSAPISGWHGVKVFGLPTVDASGRAFTASVTFTDTERTDAAKAEIKAKSGPAYDAHLAAVAAKKAAAKGGTTPPAAEDDADEESSDTEPAAPPVVTKPGARAGK